MLLTINKWTRLSLVNFLVVASLGVVLRYKILYPLYFIEQKHLLHAHSHFAFSGWVSQMLMVFFVHYLQRQNLSAGLRKYERLLAANFICSYGMLIAFAIQGYAFYSILFSFLCIVIAVFFTVFYWRDVKKGGLASLCFKTALFFNLLSSLGTMALGFLMSIKAAHQDWYLGAIYFYLHFQYNGWFFFGCMGIMFMLLPASTCLIERARIAFWMLAISCLPAYLLSVITFNIPVVLYLLAVIAAVMQMTGMILLATSLKPALKVCSGKTRFFGALLVIAVIVKFGLQALSVLPALKNLAFGYRPIIIAYLHFMLLGIVSLFLLVSIRALFRGGRLFNAGLMFFIIAVAINEVLLVLQGSMAYLEVIVPATQEMLLGAAVFLFLSILMINVGFRKAERSVTF
ncbi:hypothetical protein QTN47_05490 [Danxiaibacter flavus]|uniref:Uncharacterized protein n=1 Tax=Danxiaibacter flavus TaxID=3049108 RepID=A0ABV3ZBN4_9BACT|nr:hypothetical protein QNM32_05490 [Chitinophagaceae bacterium DXS]